MNKQTIEERLKKLEDRLARVESKNILDKDPNGDEWITIDYSVVPKDTFDRYGAKPFKIMKRKMRKDRTVWNNICWKDAKKEAEKLGLRLPHITEQLVLLDTYKKKKGDNVSVYDKDFLGIDELSYDEVVYYEWVDGPSPLFRGGDWADGSSGGAGVLYLAGGSSHPDCYIGFRCAR
ncbi:MAG: hypothetical protein KGI72_05475 [Patescibacteria group bacterium]|nr:hypothetical protein [Patescibacteria group bacterium]